MKRHQRLTSEDRENIQATLGGSKFVIFKSLPEKKCYPLNKKPPVPVPPTPPPTPKFNISKK